MIYPGSHFVVGLSETVVEIVADREEPALITVPCEDNVVSLCADNWRVYGVTDSGSIFRYPSSGSFYTDELSSAVMMAASAFKSAVLLRDGEIISPDLFAEHVYADVDQFTEIQIYHSPYTGQDFLLAR